MDGKGWSLGRLLSRCLCEEGGGLRRMMGFASGFGFGVWFGVWAREGKANQRWRTD